MLVPSPSWCVIFPSWKASHRIRRRAVRVHGVLRRCADLDKSDYNEWRVASWHTQESICYDKDQLAELGIPIPKTYADLAHPKLAGRISIPDITSGGGFANFGAMALAAGGDEQNVKPGLEMINKLNTLKFWSRGGEVVTQFGSGDVYAAVVHSGWCVRSFHAGNNVTTVHPAFADGRVGVHKAGWLVIMKSSDCICRRPAQSRSVR